MLQIHGGTGLVRGVWWNVSIGHSRTAIYEGNSEIQKLIIASQLRKE